jgi:hypothetical protein
MGFGIRLLTRSSEFLKEPSNNYLSRAGLHGDANPQNNQ